MAATSVVDAGFLVGLLNGRDHNHAWAVASAARFAPPWVTCEAALSEALHLLAGAGQPAVLDLLRRGAVVPAFSLADQLERVLELMHKYGDLPMSLADACLVRMTEMLPDPVVLTTDADFRVYRRHGRQAIPVVAPERTRR